MDLVFILFSYICNFEITNTIISVLCQFNSRIKFP